MWRESPFRKGCKLGDAREIPDGSNHRQQATHGHGGIPRVFGEVAGPGGLRSIVGECVLHTYIRGGTVTNKHRKNPEISRRNLLAALGASMGTVAVGCGSADSSDPDVEENPFGPGGKADTPGNHCEGNRGLGPAEMLAGIETIVVLCMENRSFDHYLGSLSMVESAR